jgi:hypothetical protein
MSSTGNRGRLCNQIVRNIDKNNILTDQVILTHIFKDYVQICPELY